MSLPYELNLQILYNVNRLQDLNNVLLSSTELNEIFNQNKDYIMSNVIYNEHGIIRAFKYSIDVGNLKYVKKYHNVPKQDIYNAINQSIINNSIDIVKYLIDFVEDKDKYIYSDALHCSVDNNQLEIFKVILEKYQCTIHNDAFYENDILHALFISIINGNIEITKFLLERDNIDDSIRATLFFGARSGHIEIVKMLLTKCVDINTNNYINALFISAKYGHLEVVKILLESGMNIYSNNNHILYLSARNGHLELVNFLLESGLKFDNSYYTAHIIELYNRPSLIFRATKHIYESSGEDSQLLQKLDIYTTKQDCIELMKEAIERRDLEIIRYLYYNHIDYPKNIMVLAILNSCTPYNNFSYEDNLEILNYLHNTNASIDSSVQVPSDFFPSEEIKKYLVSINLKLVEVYNLVNDSMKSIYIEKLAPIA
jgi:ankyrin repeat protein